jgi:hypothetical protein
MRASCLWLAGLCCALEEQCLSSKFLVQDPVLNKHLHGETFYMNQPLKKLQSTRVRRPYGMALTLSLVILNSGSLVMPQYVNAHPVAVTKTTKPLTESVKRGLVYLIDQQQANGGWSQGEESVNMGPALNNLTNVANVGDTCIATLALIRAGNYPNSGANKKNVDKAINFVCNSIEKSDNNSLSITDIQGTRIQLKLGPKIDTFLASLTLAEAKGHMLDKPGEQRLTAALDKVIYKIEHHQDNDGTLASGGWAPIHAQAIATKGLNRAKQEGANVSDEVLKKAESFAKNSFDAKDNKFKTAGSPVPLYAAGAALGGLQESINTNRQMQASVNKVLLDKKASKEEHDSAKAKLERFSQADQAQTQAISAVVGRMNDDSFVRGFGCNGGEEFLSYLEIGEALKANDLNKFHEWDTKISENLSHVQCNDGSWSGQHCITSRTFCTAAALLVLMVDRSPGATAEKLKRKA